MNKLTKNLAAAGLTLAMFLPLAAVAVAPVGDYSDGNAAKIAAGDLTSIRSNIDTVGEESGLGGTETDLPTTVGKIINAFLGLLGIILVVLIIYGGYKWMMAKGNSAEVEEAKKIMMNAVIGMIILMAAYAITDFVIDAILKGTGVE